MRRHHLGHAASGGLLEEQEPAKNEKGGPEGQLKQKVFQLGFSLAAQNLKLLWLKQDKNRSSQPSRVGMVTR